MASPAAAEPARVRFCSDPTTALMAAAARGELDTPQGVLKTARQISKIPKVKRRWQASSQSGCTVRPRLIYRQGAACHSIVQLGTALRD